MHGLNGKCDEPPEIKKKMSPEYHGDTYDITLQIFPIKEFGLL